jgi:hypothetical protein
MSAEKAAFRMKVYQVPSRLPKGWLLFPFLSLFIAKDRENLGIGMENSQRDGFFGSLVPSHFPDD